MVLYSPLQMLPNLTGGSGQQAGQPGAAPRSSLRTGPGKSFAQAFGTAAKKISGTYQPISPYSDPLSGQPQAVRRERPNQTVVRSAASAPEVKNASGTEPDKSSRGNGQIQDDARPRKTGGSPQNTREADASNPETLPADQVSRGTGSPAIEQASSEKTPEMVQPSGRGPAENGSESGNLFETGSGAEMSAAGVSTVQVSAAQILAGQDASAETVVGSSPADENRVKEKASETEPSQPGEDNSALLELQLSELLRMSAGILNNETDPKSETAPESETAPKEATLTELSGANGIGVESGGASAGKALEQELLTLQQKLYQILGQLKQAGQTENLQLTPSKELIRNLQEIREILSSRNGSVIVGEGFLKQLTKVLEQAEGNDPDRFGRMAAAQSEAGEKGIEMSPPADNAAFTRTSAAVNSTARQVTGQQIHVGESAADKAAAPKADEAGKAETQEENSRIQTPGSSQDQSGKTRTTSFEKRMSGEQAAGAVKDRPATQTTVQGKGGAPERAGQRIGQLEETPSNKDGKSQHDLTGQRSASQLASEPVPAKGDSAPQNLQFQLEQGVRPSDAGSGLEGAGSKPVSTGKADFGILNQIAQNVKFSATPDKTEMQIQLKPEFLGKLELTIKTENGLVTAHFNTASHHVKGIIEANLNSLRDTLAEQGVRVDQMTVTVGEDRNFSGYQQREAPQQQGRFSRGNHPAGGETAYDEGFLMQDKALAVTQFNGSTVNFMA